MNRESLKGNTLYRSWLGVLLKPKRVLNKILSSLARGHLVHPRIRVVLVRLMGVKFDDPDSVFIGSDVYFDELHPEMIQIGKNVIITAGTRILSHFYDTMRSPHKFYVGKIVIESDVFIGMNSVFTHPVTIGRGAVVGANSVVTKDIPPKAVVVGVPAKVIGQRPSTDASNTVPATSQD